MSGYTSPSGDIGSRPDHKAAQRQQRHKAEQIVGRGILLGIGWGVMVAGLTGTVLSLIYSNDNAAPSVATPMDAPQQVEPAPEVDENVAEPEPAASQAPTVGTTQAPSQGVDVQAEAADGARVPDADATVISTPTPAAPQMAQSDAQPDSADAASIGAPDVMIPDDAGADQATGENEAMTGEVASSDAPVTTGSNAAQPDAPQTENRPEIQTGSAAMQHRQCRMAPMRGMPHRPHHKRVPMRPMCNRRQSPMRASLPGPAARNLTQT